MLSEVLKKLLVIANIYLFFSWWENVVGFTHLWGLLQPDLLMKYRDPHFLWYMLLRNRYLCLSWLH